MPSATHGRAGRWSCWATSKPQVAGSKMCMAIYQMVNAFKCKIVGLQQPQQ